MVLFFILSSLLNKKRRFSIIVVRFAPDAAFFVISFYVFYGVVISSIDVELK